MEKNILLLLQLHYIAGLTHNIKPIEAASECSAAVSRYKRASVQPANLFGLTAPCRSSTKIPWLPPEQAPASVVADGNRAAFRDPFRRKVRFILFCCNGDRKIVVGGRCSGTMIKINLTGNNRRAAGFQSFTSTRFCIGSFVHLLLRTVHASHECPM